MSALARVVLVGRTNVGKSTLFNRLATRERSIVYNEPGVTRDIIKDTVMHKRHSFDLIDTGGISLKESKDVIMEAVRKKALREIEAADVVVLVVDGIVGLVDEDRELSKMLHKMGKKVVVAVNKIDTFQAQENQHEFTQLGHEKVIAISAQHGTDVVKLLDAVVADLPATGKVPVERPKFKVVLLGKPNVGKSSLMNLLAGQERAIVAEEAGTTREALAQKIRFYQEDIMLTDTAGVRRKRRVEEPIEQMMVKSSLYAVRDADIVVLMIDASSGRMVDQELKLAYYAFEEQKKGLVILYNKADKLDDLTKADLQFSLDEHKHLLSKIPQLTISCKDGKNIGRIMPLVQKVWERHSTRFSNDDLTMWFKESAMKKPLYRQGQLLRLYRVEQVNTAPITIVLHVNNPDFYGPSQLAFFDKMLRRHADLDGAPIRFFARKRPE